MSDLAYNFGSQLVKQSFIGTAANIGLSIAAPYLLGSAGKAFAKQLALRTMANPAFAGRAGASVLGGASRGAIRGATTEAKLTTQSAMDTMIRNLRNKGHVATPSDFKAFKTPDSLRGYAGDESFQRNLFSNSNKGIQTAGKIAHGMQHPVTGIGAMLGTSVFPVFPQGTNHVNQQL